MAAQKLTSVTLTKEGLWSFDQQAANTQEKVSQWLLRQRSMRFISVPPKRPDKQITQLHGVVSSTPGDSGLSMSSVDNTPPAVCRVLKFNEPETELKESSTVSDPLPATELTPKRTRLIESNRKKRWRYRMNKKRKFFERRQSSNPAASSSVGEPKQIFGPENDSNDSSSVFSERWQVFMDEAANFRQVQAEKKAKLDEKFETFVDQSPSFPKDNRKIIVPDSLNGIDRVEVSHQMKEMLQNENQALFQARFFRDRCESLEQKIRQLQTEKEGVRYFWRNRVLEGHSRAGQILKLAINPTKEN